ncbi:hypothetical protein L1987_49635 [Smallanthus sonchifolius]|uniref:Uncharacterized protein n=1 Tax=Smallanthus sonchifolius TaxID=185202 RepID=A0ACB9FV24_9ASTR|nr:hypothetical protein L1987_49635 [Smallanthus sonchifolius]
MLLPRQLLIIKHLSSKKSYTFCTVLAILRFVNYFIYTLRFFIVCSQAIRDLKHLHKFKISTFKNSQMETTGKVEFGSLLDKIQPPRLEDAGLEDCALPPDSIQEAFLKAATAVRSHIFHATSDDESEGECVNDPWPQNGYSGDKLVGITPEADPPGSCVPKKGGELPAVNGDEVVVGGREGMPDKVVEPEVPDEAEKSSVDGLQGLRIGEKKVDGEIKGKKSETNAESNEDDDEDEKRPVLTEVCI